MGKEESSVQLIEWLSGGIYRCGFLGLCQVGVSGARPREAEPQEVWRLCYHSCW